MITDKETNTVYFSDKILTDNQYNKAFERIQVILDKHKVNYKFLKNTEDIWCRDYMPIQTGLDKFVQFRYEPSYLKDDLDLQSNPKEVLKDNGIEAQYSNINLDGGNVVRSSKQVIITNRIFKEHPQFEKNKLISELEKHLEAEVLSIPDINDDMTGHSDGHVRFIDDNTILVNQLDQELKYWTDGFLKMISRSGLNYIEMPWFIHKDKKHPETAIGCYVNYLEIGNLIVFPIFEIEANKDAEAIDIISKAFPTRIIETVNINEIATNGGLLNCISWTIKK